MAVLHHLTIGAFQVVLMQDQAPGLPVRGAFPDLTDAEVALFETDPINASYTPAAVRLEDGWLLVDAGSGPNFADNSQIWQAWDEAGIAREDVSHVFISHGHADHYGGLTDADGTLILPNARYHIHRDEWAHYTDEATIAMQKARHPDFETALRTHFAAIRDHVNLVADGDEILPGITAVYAPGHSVHHTALLLESGGEALIFSADAFMNEMHIAHPTWKASVGHALNLEIQSRRKLSELAVRKGALLAGYHFTFPGLVTVTPDGQGGFNWQPISGG
jgi:glyoxylase-like metal-dependent hydrolase (beta-lactamase superfamily II)